MTKTNCSFEKMLSDRIQQVPRSFIRDILNSATSENTISFAGGLPNKKFFPVNELVASSARVLKDNPSSALQYSLSYGLPALRKMISSFYHIQGLNIPVENILITSGSQQALDLIGKTFINSGDTVIIEEPSYLGAIQAFSMYNPTFTPVELQTNGINVEQWKETIKNNKVKLSYLIPNFQNPSGISYCIEKRKQIADYAIENNSLIIEDDPYSLICFEHSAPPNIYKYAPDNTLLLGSFSKSIAPGFRLGWIVGNKQIIEKLEIAKQATDLHTNIFSQYIILDYLMNNNFNNHIKTITTAYKEQAEVMFSSIDKYFPENVDYTKSKGGMFTWLSLAKQHSSLLLFKIASQNNVAVIPGVPFYINRADTNTLRLNFSCCDAKTIEKGIKILAQCYASML